MHCQCNCAIIQLGVNYVAPPLKNSEIPSECSASNFCLVLHWWCRFQEIIYIFGIFSEFNCKTWLGAGVSAEVVMHISNAFQDLWLSFCFQMFFWPLFISQICCVRTRQSQQLVPNMHLNVFFLFFAEFYLTTRWWPCPLQLWRASRISTWCKWFSDQQWVMQSVCSI